jgi:hypothetical protein
MEKAGREGGEYKKGRMPGSRSPFRRAWARGNERLRDPPGPTADVTDPSSRFHSVHLILPVLCTVRVQYKRNRMRLAVALSLCRRSIDPHACYIHCT